MTVPVLTMVTGAAWEAELVAAVERDDRRGMRVVRRCVDLADLLATAATGIARAVLLSAELPSLDRDVVARLSSSGVAVVALLTTDEPTTQRRLRELGVRYLVRAEAGAEAVTASVLDAAADLARQSSADAALSHVPERAPSCPQLPLVAGPTADDRGAGRLVAVWGPNGAPGRTTTAVNLAAELAGLGVTTLLADADTYGGSVAQVLGLLDEAPGLAAAARAANAGRLDPAGLAGIARTVLPGLRVLTGISRADRWPELRASSLDVVWQLARRVATVTVIDCGFCLERDEELSFDTAAPRRNGATLVTLASADVVLAVASADPVGIQRLVRSLDAVRDAAPEAQVRVLVNRMRAGPVGRRPEQQVAATLTRYAGVSEVVFVPYDLAGLDRALAAGRTLSEVAPGSPVRDSLVALARQIAGEGFQGARAPRGQRRGARLLGLLRK
jgi:MinD-like ATPase involved in chromosome partitioning or flagellar assembly